MHKKLSREYVKNIFATLEQGRSSTFFDSVADTVDWTVMGTHPLAGRYHSKTAFLDATFRRLNKVLKEGVVLHVDHIFMDGNTAIVEMRSLSTANNGEPFNNYYCWIVEFNEQGQITLVRAYLDSELVLHTIKQNES